MQRCIAAILLLTSCSLNRATLVGAPGLDAGPQPDVPGLDAPMRSRDGGESDVPVTLPCTPVADDDTTCNRVDDDCNGIVDDSGCRSRDGSGCVAFTIGNVAYQSCPNVLGIDAWSGACRAIGPGYELASFHDSADPTNVSARLMRLEISDPHFVAANDFDVNGSYVWWDGATTPALDFAGREQADPANRCVVLRDDGTYDELSCKDTRRMLCSADTSGPACSVGAEATSCNGRDEDCDGRVDEALDCGWSCTASTFWRSVYYTCTSDRRAGEVAPACDMSMAGARRTILNNDTELAVVGARISGDSWLALSQSDDATSPAAAWGWGDTAVTFGTPVMVGAFPWGPGEPNDGGDNNETNHQENCGLLRVGDRLLDDRSCGDDLDFLCEASWSYGP